MFFKKLWQKLRPQNVVIPQQSTPDDNLKIAIQSFWNKVKQSEQSLSELQPLDLIEKLNNLLSENQLDVIAEIMGGEVKKHKIIFTAEGKIEHFELVVEIVKLAPSLDLFEIEAFRQRANKISDLEINFNGTSFSLGASDLLIQYHEDHRKISLDLMFAKPIAKDQINYAQTLALVILNHLLGEYDLAIKVQSINFVDTMPDSNSITAEEFAKRFDDIWKNDLKHTGVFPISESEDQLFVFELASKDDPDDTTLVQRNETANALACDINYGYGLNLSIKLDCKETLSLVYDIEDAISAAFRENKKGIHAQNSLHQATRTMLWYVEDKHFATQIIQNILNQYQDLSVKIDCEFDPAWMEYLAWVD